MYLDNTKYKLFYLEMLARKNDVAIIHHPIQTYV